MGVGYPFSVDALKTGARLGAVAGLMATLFEGLHMLASDLQVSSAYPISLSVFNLSFWVVFGVLSGCFLWLCRSLGLLTHFAIERFHWGLVFLLPFALIYGVGGRVYSLLLPRNSVPIPAFDHHLSLLWVTLLVGWVAFRFRRGSAERSSPPLAFAFEIFGIVLLIQFCTNLELIARLIGNSN